MLRTNALSRGTLGQGNVRAAGYFRPPGLRVLCSALPEPARHVPLPGNAFWILDPLQDRYFNVHGGGFIIQRTEAAATSFPKLRLRKLHQRQKFTQLQPYQRKESPGALIKQAALEQPSLPVLYDGQPVFDLTDVLQEAEEPHADEVSSHAAPATYPPSTCTGIVPVPQDNAEEEQEPNIYVTSSTSPRRTKMIGFTCHRCGARSHNAVNPRSFTEGTLVAQCGKCRAWHKIRDHFKLFHDMTGEVFVRPAPIDQEDIPPSLRMPLDPFYWQDQADPSNN
mmetsp:Transcript_11515/g.24681  ORF Transcript_11515/g.24681 Transcript_11515/m.24681 type:complete len:280 (+) Transcript_11515:147-986(+)|eukprot:CAMPEP_0202890448 /NCGR_PEP_ID=MMETSP1392-20130828/843_1 /ASSEMBLY_ACC=CAM_ASM_000868 /TAXON_ID=225041 /ORGANISM="Chlamydomonas chlamydogama, Strain SAG 11-48b" /LENGTH=279 /DNA_ID=CAMNT_0049574017 /DNA_START=137 /DNA_END=976 /DNA_ORIENTATION=+